MPFFTATAVEDIPEGTPVWLSEDGVHFGVMSTEDSQEVCRTNRRIEKGDEIIIDLQAGKMLDGMPPHMMEVEVTREDIVREGELLK